MSRGRGTRATWKLTFSACEGGNIPGLRADVEDDGCFEPWNLWAGKRVKRRGLALRSETCHEVSPLRVDVFLDSMQPLGDGGRVSTGEKEGQGRGVRSPGVLDCTVPTVD